MVKTIAQRLDDARAEVARLEAVEQRRFAISNLVSPCHGPLTERIVQLLRAFPESSFTPAEIMEVTMGNEENTRKALPRLVVRGEIERVSWSRYRAATPGEGGGGK